MIARGGATMAAALLSVKLAAMCNRLP